MILERTVELDQLGHLLVETESSGGCVVLVGGEAGIGKSTLDVPTRELAVKEAETRGILSGSWKISNGDSHSSSSSTVVGRQTGPHCGGAGTGTIQESHRPTPSTQGRRTTNTGHPPATTNGSSPRRAHRRPAVCGLSGRATYRTRYGEAVDAAVPIDMLFDEELNPVEFGNRPIDLVGEDYTPAEEPTEYAGADGECGLSGVVVAGPNGQINHGQVMKAFHSLIDMKGHGCINRIIARSDLGKGDQQVKTSDVDPLFEISAEGEVTFASETADCTHGRDKNKSAVSDEDEASTHPSNRGTDKKPKKVKPQRGRNK